LQYFEKHCKGTLEPGKLADMVILSADQKVIDPMKISSISVIETIKDGKTVFQPE
jgi:predicted amidohydrolase YtcJ